MDIYISNQTVENLGMWAIASKDSTHKVIAGRAFLRRLEQISNIVSIIFLYEYYPYPKLFHVNLQYLVSMVYAFDMGIDEDYEHSYHHAQYLMFEADKFYPNFTDHLAYFSCEIYEVAVAFAVDHEIGHHYLEHIEDLVKRRGLVSSSEKKSNEVSADIYAVYFAIEYANSCLSENNSVKCISDDIYK